MNYISEKTTDFLAFPLLDYYKLIIDIISRERSGRLEIHSAEEKNLQAVPERADG